MQGLTIEFMELGSLPIYDVDCRYVWTLDNRGCRPVWDQIGNLRHRAIVQLWEEDVMLDDLRDRLVEWLAMLGDEDGSLIFPIRGIHTLPATPPRVAIGETDDYGPFILAGLAFCPDVMYGHPLDGADPVDIIIETCQADGVDTDQLHPVAAAARQRRVEQRVQWELTLAADKAKSAIVDARSLALLHDCLTPYQHHELTEYGEFHVQSLDGYTYVIRKGFGHNVYRVEEGELTACYCIHTERHIPSYDLMLAQKLLLETAPDKFHDKANFTLYNQTTDRPRDHKSDTRVYNAFGLAALRPEPEGVWWNMAMVADAFSEVQRRNQLVARIYLPLDMREWLAEDGGDGMLWGVRICTSETNTIVAEA